MQSGVIERGFKGVLWVVDSILNVIVSFSLAFSKVTGSVALNMEPNGRDTVWVIG